MCVVGESGVPGRQYRTGALSLTGKATPRFPGRGLSPFLYFSLEIELPSPIHPCVSSSIQSEVSFEGAYGNLKRLYDKAARMYHQMKKCEMRRLSPSRKR